jgi:hypothetical protein
MTIGSSGFYMGQDGTAFTFFAPSDNPLLSFAATEEIVVEALVTWFQDSHKITFVGETIGTRAEQYVDSSGYLQFHYDSSSPYGANFAYPVAVKAVSAQNPPSRVGAHSVYWGVYRANTISWDVPAMVQTGTDKNYPVANLREKLWVFTTATGAADPGSTLFRLDTANLSTVTEIYMDDEDVTGISAPAHQWLTDLNAGDILTLKESYDEAHWVSFEVTSIVDNTGWWTLGVTPRQWGGTAVFTNGFHINFSVFKGSFLGDSVGGQVITWGPSGGSTYSSGSSAGFSSGSTQTFSAGSIFEIEETATMADPAAGFGRLWVRDDAPNIPMFTDDAGDDHVVQLGIRESESVTATNVITAAESGKTFYLNAVGGFTSTLPVPALGLHYKFIVATAPTTAYIITTDSGDNVLEGTFLDIVGELQAISAQDTLNFVASTSLVGDSLTVESDGTNWYCTAFSKADGGITVSVT